MKTEQDIRLCVSLRTEEPGGCARDNDDYQADDDAPTRK